MAIHPPLLHQLDVVKTTEWEIYSFSIPLEKGYRKGFIVRIKEKNGEIKWGEIAPLPVRSQENLEETKQQLLDYFLEGRVENLTPSVQFGLESLFQVSQFPIRASLYAFLTGSKEAIIKQAATAKLAGYTTAKVKIGSFSLKEAQEVIGLLKKQFRLRIDCNNAFSFKEALTLFAPFNPTSFDYIEDPTYELESLPNFTHPFALDETVMQYQQLPLSSYQQLYGFILKPTLLGGKKGCLPLIKYAKEHRLNVVLSPAFETGLGLLQILKMGKELGLLNTLIGLDTYRFLQQDLINSKFYFNSPKILINKEPKVHLASLTKIAYGTTTLPPL